MKDSLKESLKEVINHILVTEDLSKPSNFTCHLIDAHYAYTLDAEKVEEWVDNMQHKFLRHIGITNQEMLESGMVIHSAVLHTLGKGYRESVYYCRDTEERNEVLAQTELFRECRTAWLNFLLADLEA